MDELGKIRTAFENLKLDFQEEISEQEGRLDGLEEAQASERSERLALAHRIDQLEALFFEAAEQRSLSWQQKIGRRLPPRLRLPLWHAYHRLWLLLFPSSEKNRIYRESREFDRAKQARLLDQKRLFGEAFSARHEDLPDVIVFPVIDWKFRIQRPQQMAMSLGNLGYRVFYLSTTFDAWPGQPGFNIVDSPAKNVFVCELYCPGVHPTIYDCVVDKEQALGLAGGLDLLKKNFHSSRSIEVVQHPFWRQVSEKSQAATVVYDCMDHHAGFSTTNERLIEEENQLLEQADLVVTTSSELSRIVGKHRENVIVRNAADGQHFSKAPSSFSFQKERPVVGYFGAISEWFDSSLLAEAARAFPDWDFVLVGDTFGADIQELKRLSNVQLHGEVSYEALPGYLHAFDVCVIPFKLTPLIQCTNPVKVYEYLSAGKPVVATAMPELLLLEDLVYVARDSDHFVSSLALAMDEEGGTGLAKRRSEWAKDQNWDVRGGQFHLMLEESVPRVTVIVLCFNNLELTRACLHSLEVFTAYPNLELIVVDNASTDGTSEFLEGWKTGPAVARFSEVKVISNGNNLGFAGGNNVGLREATGDHVILLNNDTFVTRGWVQDLIRHFRMRPGLGLVGPLTNNIGNEARVEIHYPDMEQMHARSRTHTISRGRSLFEVPVVAFFCVAIPREVIDQVGLLDEDFKVGFFEDDDYCRRVRQAGFGVGIAEDVFIHHHLSASFDKLGQERRDEIFNENKKVYEAKWGQWEPHRYRPRIGD